MNEPPSSPQQTSSASRRLADEGIEARIATTTFCETCGYNLKGSPYVSTCPSCGTGYSARRAVSPSVYLPGMAEFPWLRLLAFAFTAMVAPVCFAFWVGLGRKAMLPVINFIPFGGVVLGGYALFLLPLLFRDLYRYVRHRRWEWIHAASIAEDREQRQARRAAAAETQPASGKPLVMPGDHVLERLAEEGHIAPLDWPALCATCGYRLQGLARRGICPECGSEYNARTHQMTGILSPYGGARSWGDIWRTIICASVALLFLQSMIATFHIIKLVFAILFAGGTYGFAAVAWRKGRTYRLARRALQQIQAEEDEQAPDDLW